jgi:hypothetical protein
MTNGASPYLSLEEVHDLDQAYHAARSCSAQWRVFLSAFAWELNTGAEPAEVRGFLRQIGRRMADLMVLPKTDTIEALEAAMNQAWGRIEWGWVKLFAEHDTILILHGAYPNAFSDPTNTVWPTGAAAVMEGVYGQWMLGQGSPVSTVRWISNQADPLEFRHGVGVARALGRDASPPSPSPG